MSLDTPDVVTERKPRLVFIQWDHSALPDFAQLHMRLHAKCLAHFFDLVVVTGDCDYQEVCDRYEPDVVLFESGVNYKAARHPTIRNTSAHASVPKIGLHNGDPWCWARAGFLSDMDQWGIETFFTISTMLAEHMPGLRDRLYAWPNFIDPSLFRDYDERKVIPVLVTGMVSSVYPWRQRVQRQIARYHPTLTCPHRGYGRQGAARMLYGESYARTLNASLFAPACGSVAKELLRKHLEIPASRCCLVAQRSPVLEMAGFVDMQNCVFAEADDVVDKLDHLLEHRDELERITDTGFRLVHGSHTLRQRPQIRQWFQLQSMLAPGERIVQRDPFAPLSIEGQASVTADVPRGNGEHILSRERGDALLAAGRHFEAAAAYRESVNYVLYPEAELGLARCEIAAGRARAALAIAQRLVMRTVRTYGANDPDPVEWAYVVIALLCSGDTDEAIRLAGRYPSLRHPELDRVRWSAEVLAAQRGETAFDGECAAPGRQRQSVHRLPQLSLTEWVAWLGRQLEANGQQASAQRLCRACDGGRRAYSGHSTHALASSRDVDMVSRSAARLRSAAAQLSRGSAAPIAAAQSHLRRALAGAARSSPSKALLARLQRLERRFGYFLPLRYSSIAADDFVLALSDLVRGSDIREAAVLGASTRSRGTFALLRLAASEPRQPRVHLVNGPTRGFRTLATRYRSASFVHIHAIGRGAASRGGEISTTDGPGENPLDLVLVDARRASRAVSLSTWLPPRFIAFDHPTHPLVFQEYRQRLEDSRYELVAVDPHAPTDFAILERTQDVERAD